MGERRPKLEKRRWDVIWKSVEFGDFLLFPGLPIFFFKSYKTIEF